jgi:trk system potassium uptake protein TrkA
MNIFILGAGRVGESVAESLVSEKNDITVIDTSPERLIALQDRLDLRGVVGNGVNPSVLREAGIEDCDMLIACAPQDETNLVVCKLAHDLFNVPTTIARLRSTELVGDEALLGKQGGFAVDEVICPEQSVTDYMRKLIEYPEALQVLEFARGLVSLVAVRAVPGGALVRHSLSEIPRLLPGTDLRVVAIYRGEHRVPAEGDTRIEADDEVFLLAATDRVRQVLHALRPRDQPVRRVMIAGGGKVGLRLARQLKDTHELKIIESDPRRCEYLASELPSSVLVLNADSTDENVMEDENVREMDLFIAITSDDEDNIMSCLLAKRLGARRVLALINRRAYADLVQGTTIDIAISPAQAVIGELLAYVRRGDIEAVHSLRRGAAEALEAVARGDRRTSRVVGRRIEEIGLPRGAAIGAIVRGVAARAGHGRTAPAQAGTDAPPQIIIPHHDTVIQADDHVIVFLPRKRMVRDVEKLFSVGATFF